MREKKQRLSNLIMVRYSLNDGAKTLDCSPIGVRDWPIWGNFSTTQISPTISHPSTWLGYVYFLYRRESELISTDSQFPILLWHFFFCLNAKASYVAKSNIYVEVLPRGMATGKCEDWGTSTKAVTCTFRVFHRLHP